MSRIGLYIVMDFLKNNYAELLGLTFDHLLLVAIATSIAVGVGVPLGIWLTRHRKFQQSVLGITNILQTVPSLALFGLLIPLPFIGGIGARTAIIALVLYALLPVVRNTVTGIEGVDAGVREAAIALGLTDRQVLWQVELPLARQVILSGVRVATVIGVGVATIAAAIGASGLGVYIFRGVRMNDNRLVLAGAIPAALMALAVDWTIGRFERSFANDKRTLSDADLTSDKPASGLLFRALRNPLALVMIALASGLIISGAMRWRSAGSSDNAVRVGSKDIILGEIVAQELEAAGVNVTRQFELAGNLCHDAMVNNQLDVYPEYTGTSLMAILKQPPDTDAARVLAKVKNDYAHNYDLSVSDSLGYRNDFAILVRGSNARESNLKKISDVVPLASNWRAGFGQDFVSRPDGYMGFIKTYGLNFRERPREMDLSLTYRALAASEVDLIAGNSTDGLIAALDLVKLEDDRAYFPPYDAVLIARSATLARVPQLNQIMRRLAGKISVEAMQRMNYAVDGERKRPADVARAWRGNG